jgi:hypothetical protein
VNGATNIIFKLVLQMTDEQVIGPIKRGDHAKDIEIYEKIELRVLRSMHVY